MLYALLYVTIPYKHTKLATSKDNALGAPPRLSA